MYKTEKQMLAQLRVLKLNGNLQGVKAEFEAEGSSLRDLFRLRRVTAALDIKLYLKIGGVEAIRDIKESIEIGVDGLIAPMVESKFAAKKFIDAVQRLYDDTPIHTTLNIETEAGINNIESIVNFSKNIIDNITIGRSDLSSSFFNKIEANSDFIYNIISDVSEIILENKIELTVGGGVSSETISHLIERHQNLIQVVSKLETRKAIFNTNDLVENPKIINQALRFEELYILSKKEYSDMFINSEISRLSELNRRVSK